MKPATYLIIATFASVLCACSTKTICANGNESYRPVLDPKNSCHVRIHQVLIGSDVKPKGLRNSAWHYDWQPSQMQDGQLILGHFVLTPISKSGAM